MSRHTPGPFRVLKDVRYGPSGSKYADQWWIDSDSRKAMALLEVWELNRDPKWRKANPDKVKERRATMREVAANAALFAAAPDLLEALKWALSKTNPSPCRCLKFANPPHICVAHKAIAKAEGRTK